MKITILTIGFLFLEILCGANAWAAGISIGHGVARPGGTVHIAVNVDADDDLGGINLRLEADPGLFVSADVSWESIPDPKHVLAAHIPSYGKINIVAYAPPEAPALPAQGTIFHVSLRVSPWAAPGDYPIFFSAEGAPLLASSGLSDLFGTGIEHSTNQGILTVLDPLTADINTDGLVNEKDLLILLRDWHGESSLFDPLVSDINRDETVDYVDLLILMKEWKIPPKINGFQH